MDNTSQGSPSISNNSNRKYIVFGVFGCALLAVLMGFAFLLVFVLRNWNGEFVPLDDTSNISSDVSSSESLDPSALSIFQNALAQNQQLCDGEYADSISLETVSPKEFLLPIADEYKAVQSISDMSTTALTSYDLIDSSGEWVETFKQVSMFEISPNGKYVVFNGKVASDCSGDSGIYLYVSDDKKLIKLQSPDIDMERVSALDFDTAPVADWHGNSFFIWTTSNLYSLLHLVEFDIEGNQVGYYEVEGNNEDFLVRPCGAVCQSKHIVPDKFANRIYVETIAIDPEGSQSIEISTYEYGEDSLLVNRVDVTDQLSGVFPFQYEHDWFRRADPVGTDVDTLVLFMSEIMESYTIEGRWYGEDFEREFVVPGYYAYNTPRFSGPAAEVVLE